MMIREYPHSDLAIPPGEYLAEVLSELDMTKNELARRMGRPAPKLSAIFTGDKAITAETALQLETVVGVPAHIWSGLEAEYRLTLARNRKDLELEGPRDDCDLVDKFCYSELAELGFVAEKGKPQEKIRELQRFFGVTSLKNIPAFRPYQVAFRQGKGKWSVEATSSWLRIGERLGQGTRSSPFRKKVLESALPSIRNMTRLLPEQFETQLRKSLLDAGVVLVLCPPLPNTHLQGATFWLGRRKAVLMLTTRENWADTFWFRLFHEIGHLLLHSERMVFLEGDREDHQLKESEKDADRFAADLLIPPDDYQSFLQERAWNQEAIENFGQRLGIDPGIIIGRLQQDGYLDQSGQNPLRSSYEWKWQELKKNG